MKCSECGGPKFYGVCSECWLCRLKTKISHLNEMIYPDQQSKRGRCQVCGFMGFLFVKPLVGGDCCDAISGETADSVPILAMCVTCYGTPAGCVSENVKHQRLPEEEYLKR